MAHLLYRPHIDFGDKIVTTDFLIREIALMLPDGDGGDLPVDLVGNTVELAIRDGSALIAPALFLFAGDESLFLAPAFALLDARIHNQDPVLAWQNARLSVARRAVSANGRPEVECRFGDAEPVTVSSDALAGAGRHRGAVRPCGPVEQVDAPHDVRLTIAAGASIQHRLALRALGQGAAK
jgi:hypothetical protein